MVRETTFTLAMALVLALPAPASARPSPPPHVEEVDDEGDASPERDASSDGEASPSPGEERESSASEHPEHSCGDAREATADEGSPAGGEPDCDHDADGEFVAESEHGADVEHGEDAEVDADAETDPDGEPEGESDDEEDDAGPSKLTLEWNGRIQSDLRFRPTDVGITPWYDGRGFRAGVERNQNLLVGSLRGSYGRVNFKADVNLYLYGYTRDVHEFADLTRREKIDPYRLDIQNLYLEVEDLFVKRFDLRVGQQLVDWGVGDQFNPTNNLNADDVEDVLYFGKQQGNFMVKGTYWLNDEWSHELVLVPVFKAAVLPRSAVLGLSRIDRIPVLEDELRWKLMSENAAGMNNPLGSRNATVVSSAVPDLPDMSFSNMQLGYRLGGTVLDQDVSLSYYRGRFDFPVPYKNVVTQDRTRRCNPGDSTDCIDTTLNTEVHLMYPEMHVYGLNLAGEIGLLKKLSEKYLRGIGYRLEAALIVPQKTTFAIDRGEIVLEGGGQKIELPAAEYDYDGDGQPGGTLPTVIEDRAFAKWTLGLDYTFGENVYFNGQWVHGLADEFGAGDFLREGYTLGASYVDVDTTTLVGCAFAGDGAKCAHEYQRPRIADYLVLGLDVKAMQQKLLLRLFSLFAMNGIRETYFDPTANERVERHHSPFSANGYSVVLFPSATYNFGNGLELSAGALAQLGKEWTKFGDPATGGTLLWTRANFAF